MTVSEGLREQIAASWLDELEKVAKETAEWVARGVHKEAVAKKYAWAFDPPTVLKLIRALRQQPSVGNWLDAANKAFPDKVTHDYEPPPGVGKHPLGRIEQDNGNLRYAFGVGWKAALSEQHSDGKGEP